MKKSRGNKAPARGPAGRQDVRQTTHRVNVPRSSQRPVERSGQKRRGRQRP